MGAGLPRHVGELEISQVLPQEVAFLHVLVGDVGDIAVQQPVVVEVAPVGVHPLLGVDADGGETQIGEGSVAVVAKEVVGAEVGGDVEVVVAVVIGVGVPEVEGPTGELRQPQLGGDVGEALLAAVGEVVAIDGHAAAIGRVLEALGEEPRRLGIEEVDRSEVVAEEEVRIAVEVIVEGDRQDRVEIARAEAGHDRDVGEADTAVGCCAEILVQQILAEPDHQQIGVAVVVVVEPQRVGGGVLAVVAGGDSSGGGDIGEG